MGLCVVACRGAGTDANVFIEMYGSEGAVGKTRLENSADNFERNHVSINMIVLVDCAFSRRGLRTAQAH